MFWFKCSCLFQCLNIPYWTNIMYFRAYTPHIIHSCIHHVLWQTASECNKYQLFKYLQGQCLVSVIYSNVCYSAFNKCHSFPKMFSSYVFFFFFFVPWFQSQTSIFTARVNCGVFWRFVGRAGFGFLGRGGRVAEYAPYVSNMLSGLCETGWCGAFVLADNHRGWLIN